MLNRAFSLAIVFFAVVSTACSKSSSSDSSAPSVSTPVLSAAVAKVVEKVNSAAMLKSGVSVYSSPGVQSVRPMATGLTTIWTTPSSFGDLYDGSTQTTLKDWMGDAMDPDFINSNGATTTVFGRFKSAAMIICALGYLVPAKDADGMPANGTYSATINSAVVTNCGLPANTVGGVLPMTISSTTDQTIYTKAFSVDTGEHDAQFQVLFGKKGTKINLATYEDQRPQYNQVSRSVSTYDSATGILAFEYSSEGFAASTGYEFYRIYSDDVNNVGYLLGHYGSYDNARYIQFAISGKPVGTLPSLGVSVAWKGEVASDSSGAACVDPSNGDITSDNDLSACTVAGTDVTAAATAMIETVRTSHTSIGSYLFPETLVPAFTDGTTIYTTATAN